jgi:uncharacterized damage-inducible protein DinB
MPIDTRIAAPAHQFATGARLVRAAVQDLSEEALLASPGAGSTCMLWNFGHITNTRCGLLQLLGVDHPRFHNDLFGRGASHADSGKYPAANIVAAAFDEVAVKLQSRFETLTADELSAPCPRDFPIGDKSIAGAVAFLAFHESYHAGQMAYLRKWLGKGQLAG